MALQAAPWALQARAGPVARPHLKGRGVSPPDGQFVMLSRAVITLERGNPVACHPGADLTRIKITGISNANRSCFDIESLLPGTLAVASSITREDP